MNLSEPSILVRDFLEVTAGRLPTKVALICGGKRFTYATIEGMANRLANWLIESGVRPGDRVGIFLHNGLEAVVSIFAVTKASAVFVVINPTTKGEKLAYILNNCRATALITDSETGSCCDGDPAVFVPSLKALVLCGTGELTTLGENRRSARFNAVQETASCDCPARHNTGFDLACLIYTSGSTGEPKGVMSDHSNVVFARDRKSVV